MKHIAENSSLFAPKLANRAKLQSTAVPSRRKMRDTFAFLVLACPEHGRRVFSVPLCLGGDSSFEWLFKRRCTKAPADMQATPKKSGVEPPHST
jgi:hypothetical protein